MPCSSHPPWLDHSNYTWRRVQVLKIINIILLFTLSLKQWSNSIHCQKYLLQNARSLVRLWNVLDWNN
jgi:hypothetical protein